MPAKTKSSIDQLHCAIEKADHKKSVNRRNSTVCIELMNYTLHPDAPGYYYGQVHIVSGNKMGPQEMRPQGWGAYFNLRTGEVWCGWFDTLANIRDLLPRPFGAVFIYRQDWSSLLETPKLVNIVSPIPRYKALLDLILEKPPIQISFMVDGTIIEGSIINGPDYFARCRTTDGSYAKGSYAHYRNSTEEVDQLFLGRFDGRFRPDDEDEAYCLEWTKESDQAKITIGAFKEGRSRGNHTQYHLTTVVNKDDSRRGDFRMVSLESRVTVTIMPPQDPNFRLGRTAKVSEVFSVPYNEETYGYPIVSGEAGDKRLVHRDWYIGGEHNQPTGPVKTRATNYQGFEYRHHDGRCILSLTTETNRPQEVSFNFKNGRQSAT